MSVLSRKSVAIAVAEFLGTALLAFVVMAVTKGIGYPFFVASGVGFAAAAATLIFGSTSGAHFNPAITIAMWSVRRIKALPMVVYVAAQLLGGLAASVLFSYLIGQDWNSANGTFQSHILVAEATGAFIFSLGFAAAVFNRFDPMKKVAVIGVALFLGAVASSAAAGGIINPAIALGVKSWVWGTYVLGPVLGAIIGFNLYSLLFAPAVSLAEDELPGAKEEITEVVETPDAVAVVKTTKTTRVTKKTTAKKK